MREPGPEQKPTPRPGLLDIVRVDDLWAQVKGGRGYITILATGMTEAIDWDRYTLVKSWGGSSVMVLRRHYGQEFTLEEIANIHWGADNGDLKLKEYVSVFGEFVSK